MHKLIGFGPEVYLDMAKGVNIFTANIAVVNKIILSSGTPASINFKFVIELLTALFPI